VWPPDALVPGVSPKQGGLGMAEPTRSDPVNYLSSFVRMGPAFVSRKEDLPWAKNSLQEVRSGALCRALQVGYGRSSGALIPRYRARPSVA
jgi:hypothetical protein